MAQKLMNIELGKHPNSKPFEISGREMCPRNKISLHFNILRNFLSLKILLVDRPSFSTVLLYYQISYRRDLFFEKYVSRFIHRIDILTSSTALHSYCAINI